MPLPMMPGAAKPPMPGGAGGLAGLAGKSPLPGSISGGPSGPGASPVTPVGGGAGNEAMADALVKAIIPGLHRALSAYPIGSKKYNAVINSLRALTSNFGKEQQGSTVPAALLQLMQSSKSGMPPAQGPPPPIQPSGPPSIPGLSGAGGAGGGEPEGMAA